MTDTLACPAEDCDYRGLRKSVLGHYSGKQDGNHPGGWHKAKELLPGGETVPADPEPEPEPETSTETRETGSNGNPTFGTADPVNEPEPATRSSDSRTESSDGGDQSCPECGSELYDFRQFDAGSYHNLNGTDVYVRGDYQCSNCGKWWVDE